MNRKKHQQHNEYTIENVHAHFKARQQANSEVVHFIFGIIAFIGIVIWLTLEFMADPSLLLALWWIPVFGGLGMWLEKREVKQNCERIMRGDDN